MVTKSNLVYSIAAAARILGKKIFEVRHLPFVVLVRGLLANGQKFCRFVSKQAFRNHFVDRRKEEAKRIDIVVNPHNQNQFSAISNQSSSIYKLEAQADRIACTCEDYRNQRNILKGGICKHGYSVLNHLGFTSLSDYLSRESSTARIPEPREQPDIGYVTNRRSSGEPRRKGRSVD
jgi:hypothetical protein